MKELGLLVTAKDKASGVLGGIKDAISGLGGTAGTVAAGGMAAAAAGIAAVGAGAVVAGKKVLDFTGELNSGMKKARAQMDLTEEETEGLRESAKSVFEEGFGENISGVVEGMTEVKRVTGLEGEALETATENAITMGEVFDVDVQESVKAASSAVGSGLAPNIEEAQDMITKGFQLGLPEDWIDTVNEYSGDFKRLGFTADQTLSMMNAGMEAGARNTDVIADGFREMGIRLTEGGEGVSEALSGMGMDLEKMSGQVSAGKATWGDYTQDIMTKLSQMDDKVKANRIGAELFGSKWEDVGGDVFMAAGKATEGVEGVAGATQEAGEEMQEGFGPAVERLKRTVISNLEPLGKTATDILNDMTPYLEKATEWLGEKIPVAIDKMKKIWNKVFPKAKRIVVDFWDDIKPGIDWIREQFDKFTTAILPHLKSAWEDLQAGFQVVKGAVVDDLMPAIRDLSDALGIGKDDTDAIGASVGDFAGTILDTGIKALIIGIKAAVKALSGAVRIATDVIDGFKWGIQRVRDIADGVSRHINNIKDALNNVADAVPDWLLPGSPTPFEMGLRGIGDAAKDIDLPMADDISDSARRVGGGVTIHMTNKFGPDSVRSERDITKLADKISRKTAMKTGGLPCR